MCCIFEWCRHSNPATTSCISLWRVTGEFCSLMASLRWVKAWRCEVKRSNLLTKFLQPTYSTQLSFQGYGEEKTLQMSEYCLKVSFYLLTETHDEAVFLYPHVRACPCVVRAQDEDWYYSCSLNTLVHFPDVGLVKDYFKWPRILNIHSLTVFQHSW